MDFKKKFECDKESKEQFINSTNAYWAQQAPQFELKWYGVNTTLSEDNEIVDYTLTDLGKEDSTSRLDLAMVASFNGVDIPYIFELKERSWRYPSDRYGNEGQEGWMYNMEKDSVLRLAKEKNFIPIYVNLYPDNLIRVWNIGKISKTELPVIEKPIKKQTVIEDSPRVEQKRYTLANNQGITYTRLWPATEK
jgi:hypothetical protein